MKINYAHKIAELICQRYFSHIGFKSLPPKFWNDSRFSRDYRLQIIKANALLKLYSGPAIIAALESKAGSRIYSLSAKWLDPLISQEQTKIDRESRRVKAKIEESVKEGKNSGEIPKIPKKECVEGKNEGAKTLWEKLNEHDT